MRKIFSALLIASLVLVAMLLASCDLSFINPDPEEPPVLAHVHTFVDEVVAPTCEEKGYTLHTCTTCGYIMRDKFIEPSDKKHEYVVTVVEPTCTNEGYTIKICSICGDEVVYDTTPVQHTFGEWYETQAPTCFDSGMERRDCIHCDEYVERTTEPKHTYEIALTEPTCEDAGYYTYTCTVCGHSHVQPGEKAKGHVMGDWEVHIEQTCTENGVERQYCANCDHYVERAIPKHHYDEVEYVEATCDTYGYVATVCSSCGDKYIVSYIEPHGHDYHDDWHDSEDYPGLEERECHACGKVEYRTKEN